MAVSKRLRYEVLRRDGYACYYCGARAPGTPLTVDHVIPRTLGGGDQLDNLVTACHPCNSGKSSSKPDHSLVRGVGQTQSDWESRLRPYKEAILSLFGLFDVESDAYVSAMAEVFDDNHSDDEHADGSHREFQWPAEVKAVVAAVEELITEDWLSRGVIAAVLEEIAGDRLEAYIDDARREYTELGADRSRRALERRALVLAVKHAMVS